MVSSINSSNTFTVFKNERGKFVVPEDLAVLPIYSIYEKLGSIQAESLISAFYSVNEFNK